MSGKGLLKPLLRMSTETNRDYKTLCSKPNFTCVFFINNNDNGSNYSPLILNPLGGHCTMHTVVGRIMFSITEAPLSYLELKLLYIIGQT